VKKNGTSPSRDVLREAVEVAKEELSKDQRKLRKKILRLEDEQRETSLDKVRRKLIKEYDGNVIKGLITGETEDELRESAEEAHDAWREAVQAAGVELDDEDEVDEDEELDEDEEDEDEEEDRPKKFKKIAGIRSAPKSQPVSNTRLNPRVASGVRMPIPSGRGGGHRTDPLATLRSVKGLTPSEYRENRQNILASVRQRAASGGGFVS